MRRCSIVEGGRGADKSCRLSILLIICGDGGGHFQGLVGVTVTLTCDSLSSSGVRGVDVEQSPPALSLQERASSRLRCNFSTFPQSVNWYLQNPGGCIIHLFSVPSGTKQDGRLKSTTVPAERRRSLHISSPRTTDSGTYFCGRSTMLPRHLQPLHEPSWGSAPPSASVTP